MTFVRCLLYAKKANKVLIGTTHGLYICNPETYEKENELDPVSTDGCFFNLIKSTDSFFLYERNDVTILTISSSGKIRIYYLFKLECIKEIQLNPNCFDMAHDGIELTNGNLVFAIKKYIKIYDGKNYQLINSINEYTSIVHALCSIKNNNFVSASYEDSRLIFWKNESDNHINQFCLNGIKICINKVLIFDDNKNVILLGSDNTILIIDGDKYNILKKIIIDEYKFSHINSIILIKNGSFIVSESNGNLIEYDNNYNLHSQLKSSIGDYHPLLNSVTDIAFCNNSLWITYSNFYFSWL